MPKSHSEPTLGKFDIFSKGNVLHLTNPDRFQNTTIIPGARYTPASRSQSFGATGYFSGYVFRADRNPVEIIFKKGFEKRWPISSMSQVEILAGASATGSTWNESICTHVCAQAAAEHSEISSNNELNGYIYLVDVMDIAGFVVRPYGWFRAIAARFPILEEIYEVNFMHSIPNTSVIGAVCHIDPSWFCPMPWDLVPTELWLVVNPEYEGGMAGAKIVVERFNSGSSE